MLTGIQSLNLFPGITRDVSWLCRRKTSPLVKLIGWILLSTRARARVQSDSRSLTRRYNDVKAGDVIGLEAVGLVDSWFGCPRPAHDLESRGSGFVVA
jgi:hypothetical protein